MDERSAGSTKQAFVAWMSFQRRQLSMAPLFGFDTYFLPVAQIPRILRPLQYLWHAVRTLHLLRAAQPNVIWVQLPQAPLLTTALLYRWVFDSKVKVIADCHNRILNPPWNRWPGLRRQLNACDAVVVHNETVLPKVDALGVRAELVRILEDPPAIIRGVASSASIAAHPWVLFLASFSPDEPIDELFAAARMAPEITFVIAGDADRASGRHQLQGYPANVLLPGYLSGAQLDSAIAGTDAILALTKLNDAQLSSAAEAIGAGRPMVISDTPLTRAIYPKGGVFVDTCDPKSIAQGCRAAIRDSVRLATESNALCEERSVRWRAQAEAVRRSLDL